jgi:hypothetical protein
MNFAQRMRLIWIDAKLASGEMLRRADISEAFGVSTPQASNDIGAYQQMHADKITYDLRKRGYFREGALSAFADEIHEAVRTAQHAVQSSSS